MTPEGSECFNCKNYDILRHIHKAPQIRKVAFKICCSFIPNSWYKLAPLKITMCSIRDQLGWCTLRMLALCRWTICVLVYWPWQWVEIFTGFNWSLSPHFNLGFVFFSMHTDTNTDGWLNLKTSSVSSETSRVPRFYIYYKWQRRNSNYLSFFVAVHDVFGNQLRFWPHR